MPTIPEIKSKPQEAKKTVLKLANKRKLNPQRVRAEAFFFLNQLGRKLLIKNNVRSRKYTKDNASLENHKIGSESSNISSDNIDESKNPERNLMMSPIKRRKEIISPSLNNEQTNILDLWAVYKAGDFLFLSEGSSKKQRNSSQTPIPTKTLINAKTSSNNVENEAKSCTKLSVMKMRKKKKKAKKGKSTRSNHKHESNENSKAPGIDLYKNMITISKPLEDSPQGSPSRRKPVKQSKKELIKMVSFCNNRNFDIYPVVTQDTVKGLGDILVALDSEATEVSRGLVRPRKLSWNVNEAEVIAMSPRKSPKKRRKMKASKKYSVDAQLNQSPTKKMHKFNTLLDLTDIVASLDDILEEGKF